MLHWRFSAMDCLKSLKVTLSLITVRKWGFVVELVINRPSSHLSTWTSSFGSCQPALQSDRCMVLYVAQCVASTARLLVLECRHLFMHIQTSHKRLFEVFSLGFFRFIWQLWSKPDLSFTVCLKIWRGGSRTKNFVSLQCTSDLLTRETRNYAESVCMKLCSYSKEFS